MRRTWFRSRADVPADARLEPLRTADRTMLATDCGPAPMHLAAVLLLDGADDGTSRATDALLARSARVDRLTQVLVGPPGRPAWWRDPAADPATHLTVRRLPAGGEDLVLDEAADLLCTPLDRSRPLWSARWLVGWDASPARRGALVLVLHHVLVDGVGGLGVLAALADGGEPGELGSPAPVAPARPADGAHRGDGAHAADGQHPADSPRPGSHGPRAWLHGLLELGLGMGPPTVASRTFLNRPTGARRRVRVVRVPLADLHDGARRHGASINDALVAAVVGALERLLAGRAEHPSRLVVSVPVSGRPAGNRDAGNDNGAFPVAVPTGLDRDARVRAVAAATARRKARPRGRSALPLGAAFRALAAAGLFRPFIEHQRLVHIFETNVRGPGRRVHLAGYEVSGLLPLAVNPGTVGASFAALSYGGELAVTLVTDPAAVPDPDALAALLAAELGAFAHVRGPDDERPR